MNIYIAGGGRVGSYLARLLSQEHHSVTVIESNPQVAQQIDAAMDVRTVQGNAASIMLLNEIQAGEADLFVSATGNDEVNLIATTGAKGLGAKQVLARADNPSYIESNILYETILGVDYVLSPDALTAQEIANYVQNPGIVAAESFGRGRVHMRQIQVTKSPTTGGKTIRDIHLPPGVLLAMISHTGNTIVPHGDAVVLPGDLLTIIGEQEQLSVVAKTFQGTEPRNDRIVIMGGSSIGLYLAQILENQQRSVKVFELKPNQCEILASKLTNTHVVCRDATSRAALEEEHVNDTDMFVAATDDDERNIVACILAKEVGARRSVAVVHHPDFAALVMKLGVDHAVTPRICVANRVLRLVHQKYVTSLAVLDEGQVEILEFSVTGDSLVVGKKLSDIRFPRNALVATIIRGEQVIVPKGNNELHTGDSVIMVAAADSLEAVRKLFQR